MFSLPRSLQPLSHPDETKDPDPSREDTVPSVPCILSGVVCKLFKVVSFQVSKVQYGYAFEMCARSTNALPILDQWASICFLFCVQCC
jgi:hypothetical protein